MIRDSAIKVGGRYLTRCGLVVTIVAEQAVAGALDARTMKPKRLLFWTGRTEDGARLRFWAWGRFWFSLQVQPANPRDLDLVAPC